MFINHKNDCSGRGKDIHYFHFSKKRLNPTTKKQSEIAVSKKVIVSSDKLLDRKQDQKMAGIKSVEQPLEALPLFAVV